MITGKTLITGVIGHPIEHSFSPPMHNTAYEVMDMDYSYVAFHVMPKDIGNVIKASKTMNIVGLNVTIPYKTDIIEYLDEIDETARMINAVNTISFKDGVAKGYNTDGIGAISSIENYTPLKDKSVLVIGSGGAAKAITFTLLERDIDSLSIANRTQANACSLIDNLKQYYDSKKITYCPIDDCDDVISNVDVIINTTPIGMYPNVDAQSPINTEHITSKHTVMDIIYNPLETDLLRKARNNGAKIIYGKDMLVNQAVESFKIFTGRTPSANVMMDALIEQL